GALLTGALLGDPRFGPPTLKVRDGRARDDEALRTQHQAGTDTGLGDIKRKIYFRREQVKPARAQALMRGGAPDRHVGRSQQVALRRGNGVLAVNSYAVMLQKRSFCRGYMQCTKSAIALIDPPLTRLSRHRNVFFRTHGAKKGSRYG